MADTDLFSGVGAGVVSTGLGALANSWLQGQAFDRNKKMWEEANAYNSPSAQIDRLKSAGLNPALVYGHGAVATMASNTPSVNPVQVNPTDDISKYINAQKTLTQSELMGQQMDILAAQQEKINSEIGAIKANTRNVNATAEATERENKAMRDLSPKGSDGSFFAAVKQGMSQVLPILKMIFGGR